MLKILSDIFLVAAVIAGPVLLAAFFIYGANATRKMDRQPQRRAATERGTQALYHENEEERKAQENAAAESGKLVDVIERKTGTTG